MSSEIESIMGIQGVEFDTNSDNELEGLGQRIRQPFSVQQKSVIKKFTAQKTRQAMLNSVASRGQRHMLAKVSELPDQAQIDINEGKSRFVEVDYYFRRVVVQGTNDLVKASDQQKTGLSNFNSNRVPTGTNMDITHIALAYGFSASVTDPAGISFTNAADAETGGTSPLSIPIGFVNGEMIIKVNGAEKVNLPVKKFFRDGFSVNASLDKSANAVEVTPFIVPQDATLEIILKTADGITITSDGSNHHFAEVRMIGAGIVPKG